MQWQKAPDIDKRITRLIVSSESFWINGDSVISFRSSGSKSRAIARIWGLPTIWQLALNQGPTYALEVISERFDKLPKNKQDHVLLHELAHIPSTFSGALLPHTRKGKGSFHSRLKRMIQLHEQA